MNDKMGLKGRVEFIKVTPTGIVEVTNIPNTIVNVGLSQVAGFMVADVNVGSAIDWMSIGSGSGTIAGADTTLGNEYLKYGIGSIVGTRITTTETNDTARWIGSFGIEDTKAINEAGLFNASGVNIGSMLSRTTFATINVVSGDTIRATWDIAIS